MKTLSRILALTAIIPLAAAAAKGYITSFTAPDCVQAAGAGGAASRVETTIPLKTCLNIPLFTSFQGGLANPCPKGKLPKLTAYTKKDCAGTAVDGGTIPLDYTDGPCKEIVVKVGSLSVGGQSGSFACV